MGNSSRSLILCKGIRVGERIVYIAILARCNILCSLHCICISVPYTIIMRAIYKHAAYRVARLPPLF